MLSEISILNQRFNITANPKTEEDVKKLALAYNSACVFERSEGEF